jgi:hypothetical protein
LKLAIFKLKRKIAWNQRNSLSFLNHKSSEIQFVIIDVTLSRKRTLLESHFPRLYCQEEKTQARRGAGWYTKFAFECVIYNFSWFANWGNARCSDHARLWFVIFCDPHITRILAVSATHCLFACLRSEVPSHIWYKVTRFFGFLKLIVKVYTTCYMYSYDFCTHDSVRGALSERRAKVCNSTNWEW